MKNIYKAVFDNNIRLQNKSCMCSAFPHLSQVPFFPNSLSNQDLAVPFYL